MSSYTPDSVNPNQNVVLIPVKGETIAVSNVDIVGQDGVMEIGKMQVLGHDQGQKDVEVIAEEKRPSMDDYMFQFYMGSLTVVGLLLLFRFIQKT
jgi:hypothetical protein